MMAERGVSTDSFDTRYFVQCDNCSMPAQRQYVESSSAAQNEPEKVDFTSNFLKGFREVMPQPETRTERILYRLIGSHDAWESAAKTQMTLVELARTVESQLDDPRNSSFYVRVVFGNWGPAHWDKPFVDRASFVEWMLCGIGWAKEETSLEGVPSDVNINRLVHHFLKWLDLGAPIE